MNDDNKLDELVERTRRIETRLMRVALHLGCDPTEKKRIMQVEDGTRTAIEIAGLDVSIGDILAYCKKTDIRSTVELRQRGKVLALFTLWRE
jgi:hypothetical protein